MRRVGKFFVWALYPDLVERLVLVDRFHRKIAGSKLVRFNELAHVPQEEDPACTVKALKEFLVEQR